AHVDAGDPQRALRRRLVLPARPDLAHARQQLTLECGELRLAHLAELQAHLRRQQLLAKRVDVVHLLVDGVGEPAQHELDPADQQRVEDDHGVQAPRPARLAMTATSSVGSTGLGTWTWYPASSARARSSTRGYAVRATAGIRRPRVASPARTRRMRS